MGASQSALPPTPVATLPLQRTPVMDGTSGLQYSGQTYANQYQILSDDICKDAGSVSPAQINDVMPNSISTTTLTVDQATGRIGASDLQAYVANLVTTGNIPGQMPTFDKQATADKAFYESVQSEYCFYETRYRAALKQFLDQVSNPNGVDEATVSATLSSTVNLNQRLNSLLEIINHVGNERAKRISARGPEIDKANASLDNKIAALSAQKNFLTAGNSRIRTQEEMMRYSAEKGRAMNIQIMFFVAFNVVALGTVLTVYKSMGPGPAA
jgi:hypothetical protein